MNSRKARQCQFNHTLVLRRFRGIFGHSHMPQMKDYDLDIFFSLVKYAPVSGGMPVL